VTCARFVLTHKPWCVTIAEHIPKAIPKGLRAGKGAMFRHIPAAVCILASAFLYSADPALAASWTPLANPVLSGSPGTMFQLTDGSIMVGSVDALSQQPTRNWMRLTPDIHGSYVNGIWTANPIAPMNRPRLFFASQILPDGRVWVLGGEYSGVHGGVNPPGDWTGTGEIYDPVLNSWSPILTYPPQSDCPTLSTTNGDTTIGSAVITGIPSTFIFQTGWIVRGTGIPSGTTIISIDSPTQIHVSANATSTRIGVRLSLRAPACFGDVPTILLPGGRILAGNLTGSATYIYDVATNTWAPGGSKVYTDPSDEEGWVKLADGTILNYDLDPSINAGTGYAEVYNPSTNLWSGVSPSDHTANGVLPLLSSTDLGDELGPAVRLQDGRAFILGANGHTALYTPATNTWGAGPDIMGTLGGGAALFGADDAPAAVMPNGHVLFAADAAPAVNLTFSGPTQIFDFDPVSGTITPVSLPAALVGNLDGGAYQGRMLVLPTGQVLFTDGISDQLWVYTPDGPVNPALRPVINQVMYTGGGIFTLTGKQLNGQGAGAAYGDDAQMDENYPIVRLTNSAGNVYYARTTNWSSVGVGTGTVPETVNFTLNPAITLGNYSVVVSGAGISSNPIFVNITASEVAAQ
jgi:hypothetical protein